MKNSNELELILFASLFQKQFHGQAGLDQYLEVLGRFREQRPMMAAAEGSIESSFYRSLGLWVTQEELVDRRQQIQLLTQQGVHFVFPGHPDFPSSLLVISEPPFLLSYRGHPVWKESPGFAVVGSREPEPQSRRWIDLNLGPALQQKNFFIASGGARGVDQCAHRAALLKKRPTVAFLPAGLGQVYPESFQSMISPILSAGGAVVSEYGFNEPMRKHYFHARNRLISGITECTLIVQAARKSGTLITGRQALEQGKPVFVVPSHPLEVNFQGGLDLLLEGATPVRDHADLLILLESEFLSFQTSTSGCDLVDN